MIVINKLAVVNRCFNNHMKGTTAMEKLKRIFLINLKEITRLLESSTDKTSEFALLIVLYLFGEETIHSSLLTPQRKRRLYRALAALREGTDLEAVYHFFQRVVLEWIRPLLQAYQSLSETTRKYRRVFALVLDDTSLKVFGRQMEGAKKLHDGKGYFVGYHVVFVSLCLGSSFRIPIAFRIYRPDRGVTRPELAAQMLAELLPRLPGKPGVICFDSVYNTADVHRVIRDQGLNWVSKSKSNWKYFLRGDDYERITGQLCLFKDLYYRCVLPARELVERMQVLGLKLLRVVRRKIGKLLFTYDAEGRILVSSNEALPPQRVATLYQLRWTLEEVFRIFKQHLALTRLYQRTIVGQALAHGIKMLALICLLRLRYESRMLRNMTYRQAQETLRNLFVSRSKFGQSPYAELMKYRFV
jgi:IS4 transposase